MLNFFFKRKQDIEKENTINNISSSSKTVIDNFIKFAGKATDNRAKIFNDFMSFVFDSDQWSRAELEKKDDEDDSAMVFNFSQEYVDRYMAKLFPRNPHTGVVEVGVKVTEQDVDKNQKYEDEIIRAYDDSSLANILLEQGNDFLVGGAGCFYYPQDPITKRAEIFSLDPTSCYLGWSGSKLVQFAFREYQGDGKYKTIYYDLSNIIIEDGLTGKIEKRKNEFNFIPFSWIPNSAKPHSHEGLSKIGLLSNLDRAYNNTASNFNKRIEENTDPHLVIKSDMTDGSKIERGRKKKTRIGKDDDMQYMELKEGKEVLSWMNTLERRITGKTGLVYSSGGLQTNVSGRSLSFQFSDMTDLIGFMRLRWDSAFREMNHAILSYKFKESKYKTTPIYHPFLMQENSERVDEYATMIEKDLISHKDAIDELRGVENAEIKISEILEEKKKFNAIDNPVKPVNKEI